ncbi:oxidoreductase [Coprinopsis cinerea okayama7|uniref:Oxidoreductase n=1 Tax=Coprinopsis cinerea (strain Okayama-7 / 130 / ATCC MYA-4618 / FGSC 9003) TaxID=240176 RepID=A8NH20_COPC7|nr:oxidoreductase [Coprinopsis cinerea okayama7\|eukprot:XP_001833658.1 oxidoreductase [Coprinopsis cinerea okayama7\
MPPTTTTPLDPVLLPCGRTVKNRLAKVALYEHLAVYQGGPPNEYHYAVYSEWGKHNWGLVFTGNVQVSNEHLTFGRDIVLPKDLSPESLAPYRKLSSLIQGPEENGEPTLAIVQLSHAGRQSLSFGMGGRGLLQRPLGPSPIRVGTSVRNPGIVSSGFHHALFSVPKEMTAEDIEHVISRFVYDLVAQFLNPKSNTRTDEYALGRGDDLRLLREIVTGIRAAVPPQFVVGIKLNAADYTDTGSDDQGTVTDKEERAMKHILEIAQWGGVDFIEISGGDYESPDFINARSQRQAVFSKVSQHIVEALEKLPRTPSSPPLPLIMLTGGLKSPALIHTALSAGHAQLVGIGRQGILCPSLPEKLKSLDSDPTKWPDTPFAPEPEFTRPPLFTKPGFRWLFDSFPKISLIGAGVNVSWYEVSMRYLAEKVLDPDYKAPYPDYSLTGAGAILTMYLWTAKRATTHATTASQVRVSQSSLISVIVLGLISILVAVYGKQYIGAGGRVHRVDLA